MSELLKTEEISKTVGYLKKETIVDRVSISLQEGEILGLLGPNGAGKTTTIKMLLGLTSITSGSARMFGATVPTPASRAGVGFLPEAIQHPNHLTVHEYLHFHACLSGVSNGQKLIDEHLGRVGMQDHHNRLLNECSKGMRQRVDIARILLRQARLIFLDEPFSGLDPCGQVMLKELLTSLKKEKIAILVNSHAAGILEDVCDRVCVMNKGKIVLSDSLANLLKTSKIKVVADFADSTAASEFAGRQAPISFALKMPARIEFVLDDANRCNELAGAIMAAGGKLIEVSPVMLTLDQLFVRVLSEQQQAKTGENA